jgi:predicted ABC-type ATPase
MGLINSPQIVVIAGPNGAGKTTSSRALLDEALGVAEFVNADVIASGLAAFHPESVAIEAGRLMLSRLKQLAEERASFAFETTLASRSFAPWIAGLVKTGYAFHLCFFWLPKPEYAVLRVAERVRGGGHHVPEETIRRRYERGLKNFFGLYQPIATTWRMYDNTNRSGAQLIASGCGKTVLSVANAESWDIILRYKQ